MSDEKELDRDQLYLLTWLAREDYSSLGECYGSDLDELVDRGLAEINGRRVSVTDAGFSVLKAEVMKFVS